MADLKILASFPVQYQAPLFREIVKSGIDIQVGYYHPGASISPTIDDEFGQRFAWDIDLISGYSNQFFHSERASFSIKAQIRIAPRLLKWSLQEPKTPLLLLGWFAEIIWLVWLLRIIFRMPVMLMGDNTVHFFELTPKPKWRVALLGWLIRNSSAILYVGKQNYKFWQQFSIPKNKLFSTPHSVDMERFETEYKQNLSARTHLCRQYNLDPSLPTFLFCGKLIRLKRPVELLQAYIDAGLSQKAQMVFVGDGELRDEIQTVINDKKLKNVHILGFFNQSLMPVAYVIGEVVCLVSQYETWGLVINEAIACGRPVIVSDTVGCAPDLVDQSSGWVTSLEDHSELARTLLDAYKRYDKWYEMGANGRKKIYRNTYGAMIEGITSALISIKKAKR